MREPLRLENLSNINRERLESVGAIMPIYYVGRQWAVTGWGIEELPSAARHTPYYNIVKQDLTRDEWPRHMAEKTWVDTADFNQAFEIARGVMGGGAVQ